jgi:hypothetical protein
MLYRRRTPTFARNESPTTQSAPNATNRTRRGDKLTDTDSNTSANVNKSSIYQRSCSCTRRSCVNDANPADGEMTWPVPRWLRSAPRISISSRVRRCLRRLLSLGSHRLDMSMRWVGLGVKVVSIVTDMMVREKGSGELTRGVVLTTRTARRYTSRSTRRSGKRMLSGTCL